MSHVSQWEKGITDKSMMSIKYIRKGLLGLSECRKDGMAGLVKGDRWKLTGDQLRG